MAISFGSLPLSASLSSIYGQAGRIFEEQVRNHSETDFTRPEYFDKAIWHIAENACGRGFSALQYMKTEQVASGMGNQISAYGFGSLPLSASLPSIYGQAGRIFEEQVRNHPETDFTRPEYFDKAIWHIAEKVCGRGFSALQYMEKEQVASGMGNYISAYIAAQRHGGVTPLIFAALFAALGVVGVTAVVAPHLLLALAIKAAALAHAHPHLTANMLIAAAQAVIGGKTPADVAKAVSINAGGAIVAQPLESWLAGLKFHQ